MAKIKHSTGDFPNRLISGMAAAAYLGVNEVTLNRWVNRGDVPQVIIGKARAKYDIRDLDEIIEKNKQRKQPLKVSSLRLAGRG